MKKLLLLALTALMMAGCNRVESNYSVNGIPVVVIDSCEYLRVLTYNYNYVYSHKGNCRFCKERRQKEFEELVIKLKEK